MEYIEIIFQKCTFIDIFHYLSDLMKINAYRIACMHKTRTIFHCLNAVAKLKCPSINTAIKRIHAQTVKLLLELPTTAVDLL